MRRILVLFLLSILASGPLAAETKDTKYKNVLLLLSQAPTAPSTPRILNGIFTEFGDPDSPIDVEFLDTDTLSSNAAEMRLVDLLNKRLNAKDKYDLVMTGDDAALNFVLRHRETLFPEQPIVFFGLRNQELAEQLKSDPSITGVAEECPISANIELIKTMFPTRNNLTVIVGDATLADRSKLLTKAEENGVGILNVSLTSETELTEKLNSLGETDVVLLTDLIKSGRGVTARFDTFLNYLTENTQVPIFHVSEDGIGRGITGGIVNRKTEHAKLGAQTAKEILSGKPPSSVPIQFDTTNLPIFDFQQINRFDIPVTALPEDSVLINDDRPFSNQSRENILAGALGLLCLIAIIIYLVRDNRTRKKLNSELEEKNKILELLMDSSPDGISLKNPDGTVRLVNKATEKRLKRDRSEIIGKHHSSLGSPELKSVVGKLHRLVKEEKQRIQKNLIFNESGKKRFLETIHTPVLEEDGNLIGVLTISRDITEKKEAEQLAHTLFKGMDQAPVGVLVADINGKIEHANKTFEIQNNIRAQDIVNTQVWDHSFASCRLLKNTEDWKERLLNGQFLNDEFCQNNEHANKTWIKASMSGMKDNDGNVQRLFMVEEDITHSKNQEEKIIRQAFSDPLTGLPNRTAALDKIDKLMQRAAQNDSSFAVMYIDLDDFKKVNDSLGHDIGDFLLKEVASRFLSALRPEDTVCRIGGDEFIVLANKFSYLHDVSSLAKRINDTLLPTFTLDNHDIQISSSIGIALYPKDGDSPKELLRRSDTAMYQAKRDGGNAFAYFTDELNKQVHRRFQLEGYLNSAIENNEFSLRYQPQIDLARGCVTAVEVLLRWHNKTLGWVSPDEFIAVAEQTGGILGIGRFVLSQALKELTRQDLAQNLNVAINLSPRQLRDRNFYNYLVATCEENNFPLTQIEIEVTEGVLIEQRTVVEHLLNKLSAKGVRLAMDDFGTGYSSLSYLRKYPFDTLKIDREFVDGITKNSGDREMVHAIQSMADGLGINVIAEGVETSEQSKMLESWGCTQIQGYYYSKPVPIEELGAVIARLNGELSKTVRSISSATVGNRSFET